MGLFLVELTDLRSDWLKVIRTSCAASANESGTRFLTCIHVPKDASCLFIVEAVSHDTVRASMDRARLPNCRIVQVVEFDLNASPEDDPTHPWSSSRSTAWYGG